MLYDAASNRLVIERRDQRHDRFQRQVIDNTSVFAVPEVDPQTGQPVVLEVPGGVGYLQQLADESAVGGCRL